MMMHVHNVAKFQEEPGSEMTDAQKDCVFIFVLHKYCGFVLQETSEH